MNRSEINQIMSDAVRFIESLHVVLPPFAFWSEQDWMDRGYEYDEIRDNMMGWDITDFGSGDFNRIGLLMFTLRNGNFHNGKYVKPYAEKLLIVEEDQVTPYHFHWRKMEDIINRGGGNLMVQVYNATSDGGKATTPVDVHCDGRAFCVDAGQIIRIRPGESITLPTGQYHSFWAENGMGKVLLGEVSTVNDDTADNRFYESVGRFPEIEEDVVPLFLLSNEYPQAKREG